MRSGRLSPEEKVSQILKKMAAAARMEQRVTVFIETKMTEIAPAEVRD